MAQQTIHFTALPNGFSDDGASLRVSVLVSPRLEPDGDGPLAAFPDFVDWPATIARSRFAFSYGANPPVAIDGDELVKPARLDERIGLATSRVWTALFPDTTLVKGYQFRDLTDHKVLSFPAAEMDGLVRGLYSSLAQSAGDQLPVPSALLSDEAWSGLFAVLRQRDRANSNEQGLRDPQKEFAAFKKGEFDGKSLNNNLARFELFHTPSAKAKRKKDKLRPGDTKRAAEWVGYDPTPLPKPEEFEQRIDFHQIVAAMNQYPVLLRLLGLVIDVLIPKQAFAPAAQAPLSVAVTLPPETVPRVPDASPLTNTLLAATRFQAVPRVVSPGVFQLTDGLLNLDPKTFALLQADVDGSSLKTLNFARSLLTIGGNVIHQTDPVSGRERDMGAPSLRNAGLMLVHAQRSDMLEDAIARQKGFNDAAQKRVDKLRQNQPAPAPPIMAAQDLIRGYRIDIWDDVSRRWHSLCERHSIYDVAAGTVVIDVPREEGIVRLAATTSVDKTSNPDIIWLHETLVAWAGWSLCAPPPGNTIHHQSTQTDADGAATIVHEDPVGDPEAEIPPGLNLRTAFNAARGSLPRLRYGRRYWIRARAVDLAGNSLAPQAEDFGPEDPKTRAEAYLRFDPISAPALALVKPTSGADAEPPLEGESMERIAIRTLNDTPDLNTVPTAQRARRFAVPSRTTQREAEQHGMLDQDGSVDSTAFAKLVARDNSLANEKIVTPGPNLGEPDVETGYAVMAEGDALPYLPDPLSDRVAARLFDHPTFPSDKIISIPFYDGTQWPEALPFTIEILDDPTMAPTFEDASRTLFVPLPKAARVTLRLSIRPRADALKLLGVWNWLTPPQQQKIVVIDGQPMTLERLARNGQHWMLTPWRNVELVHAVQRPLIAPDFGKLLLSRNPGETFVKPSFDASCSIASTDRIDLRAHWNEPFEENVPDALPENRERVDHAFSIKITDKKSFAGPAEFESDAPDHILVNRERVSRKLHEFHDTRYRRIEYWLEGTTKFREFLSPGLLKNKKGEPTEANIAVIGKRLRDWVPCSAPPPAPDVLYVVPTFGWIRSGDRTDRRSWRRGGGLRVYLNRPWNASGYGEMLAVVLPAANFNGEPDSDPADRPVKNFVTQWGNDPIWLSDFVPGLAPRLRNFPLARTTADPDGKWLPKSAPIEEAEQPSPFRTTGLDHPDYPNAPPQALVDIAPHDVFYDGERQLWYCDIEFTWGAAYFPFVRLALARYQPTAVSSAHLSNVVLADFMSLIPDRWLNVTQTRDPRTRRVSVFGNTYSDSSSHVEAKNSISGTLDPQGAVILGPSIKIAPSSIIEVWVERFEPGLGEDFGWVKESQAFVNPNGSKALSQFGVDPHILDASAFRNLRVEDAALEGLSERALESRGVRATELMKTREFEAILDERLIGRVFLVPPLWDGTVTLPANAAPDTRHRLVIAEYEEYIVDDENPYDQFINKKDRRLVFMEYVAL